MTKNEFRVLCVTGAIYAFWVCVAPVIVVNELTSKKTLPSPAPSCGIFEPVSDAEIGVIAELEKMPTIKHGRSADLKFQDEHARVWLKKDSAGIMIEQNVNGKWVDQETQQEI